jgi:hypothetical protein
MMKVVANFTVELDRFNHGAPWGAVPIALWGNIRFESVIPKSHAKNAVTYSS